MNSNDLLEFSTWLPWSKGVSSRAPHQPGVYVIRLKEEICRLTGKSDLVYIGSSQSLRTRLRDHRSARDSGIGIGLTLRYIEQRLGELQVAWQGCTQVEEAKEREWNLLAEYKDDHIELPPLNNSEPERSRGFAMRQVRCALSDLLNQPVTFRRAKDFVAFARLSSTK